MSNLLINPQLEKSLNLLSQDPPAAILLTGPSGSGKKSVIDLLAKKIAHTKPGSKIITITVLEDKKHIVLDQIKELKKMVKVKDNSYRIILIPDAERMTLEVQNSLLKLLEEPPENVIFIFSSSLPHLLLRTVRSRLIIIKYLAPSIESLQKYAQDNGIAPQDAEKYIRISNGRMGVFNALVTQSGDHRLISSIEEAKDVLGEVPKERLARLDSYTKDSERAIELIDSLMIICDSALQTASAKGNHKAWLNRLDLLNESYELLVKNVATKLVLTKLFLVL